MNRCHALSALHMIVASYLLVHMYYSLNLGEKSNIHIYIFNSMYACAFISKFSDGISTYLIGQNVPILNYFDHRATIHQLPFTHFFHYLPTSWCSLNSSWPSLWLWRTRLAASLILCRSSSSSSSGSIIINVHNKQKIGSKCRRSKQSSVQNILIPKMKPEWNTDIFEILNMYFSLKDSLSVIITNPNKNHCLHYLHK